jgi:hypothetical protein
MKKLLSILFLTCVFCLSAFADGETPVGGRICQPPSTPCLTAPVKGGEDPKSEDPIGSTTTKDTLNQVKDWLLEIFG